MSPRKDTPSIPALSTDVNHMDRADDHYTPSYHTEPSFSVAPVYTDMMGAVNSTFNSNASAYQSVVPPPLMYAAPQLQFRHTVAASPVRHVTTGNVAILPKPRASTSKQTTSATAKTHTSAAAASTLPTRTSVIRVEQTQARPKPRAGQSGVVKAMPSNPKSFYK